MGTRRVIRSIWLTTLWLYLLQSAVVAGILVAYDIDIGRTRWLLFVSPLVHVAFAIALTALRHLFRTEEGIPLDRVNLPNSLSMARLSSAPTLLWFVLLAETEPVVPVVVTFAALVFLTDLLDGQISRRTRQITEIGKYLDSSSDYTLLAVISVAMVIYAVIPGWLFVIILVRLGLQWLAQVALFVIQGWTLPFRTTFLGKTSIFAIMLYYALALLGLLQGLPRWYEAGVMTAGIAVAFIALTSLMEKVYVFLVDLRNALEIRRQRPSQEQSEDARSHDS